MDPRQVEIYRAMNPAQRLRVAFGLHDFAYRRIATAIAREQRHLGDDALRHEVLRRFIGEPGTLLRRGPHRT